MQRFATSLALAAAALPATGQAQVPDTILYGVAYYDEYTPVDRVDEDARMMKAAGISVVRIAESTWGTLEPQPGCSTSATSIARSPRCIGRASR
ncbi:MAG: beta-galactosidase [Pseudomonas sp.]